MNKKQIILISIFLILILIVLAFFIGTKKVNSDLNVLTINNHKVKIEKVSSEENKARGLSGRKELLKNEGMLFVFENSQKWGIWMKDMLFSIDIVWLDEKMNIVDYKENVSPDTFPKIFFPNLPSKYVLELPSGSIKTLDIEKGIAVY
ncbi:MAG: DUF192 domain-containing protein [bacterium]|nr:DUF192 domain-containing protein [bacterium]